MQRVHSVGTAALAALMAAHRRYDNGKRPVVPCPTDPCRAPAPLVGMGDALGGVARPISAVSLEQRVRRRR